MSRDYLPNNDQDLETWVSNFYTVLLPKSAQVGLGPGDLADLEGAKDEFIAALSSYLTKKGQAMAAGALKNTGHDTIVEMVRPLVRRINNHPGMTDELRAALGLNIPGSGVSTQGIGPDVPGIFLETSLGQVTVHFGTEPQNERTNSKPSWAKGCNVYRKKAGEDTYSLMAFETSSPYVDGVYGNAADYTYVVRYRGKRSNDEGAESTEATIAARGAMAA